MVNPKTYQDVYLDESDDFELQKRLMLGFYSYKKNVYKFKLDHTDKGFVIDDNWLKDAVLVRTNTSDLGSFQKTVTIENFKITNKP